MWIRNKIVSRRLMELDYTTFFVFRPLVSPAYGALLIFWPKKYSDILE